MIIEIPGFLAWLVLALLTIWGVLGWVSLYFKFMIWRSKKRQAIYDEAMKLLDQEGVTITRTKKSDA